MSTPVTGAGDDCAACAEDGSAEPSPLYNRPGQRALAYRIGTHASFFQRMLARLPREALPDGDFAGSRPLAALTTRSPEDPAVALLDAWATAADVLTFYQERIANEGFLRTATERRSVLELAREVGYELKPGVAASTYLAFTVETAPGSPASVQVAKGVQVLSIPGQDERPQTFETVEALEARAAWNELRPRQTTPQDFSTTTKTLYLQGLQTGLQVGDALLLVGPEREQSPGSERWDLRIVLGTTLVTDPEDPARSHTVVTWEHALGSQSPAVQPSSNPRAYVLRLRANLFGYNAADFKLLPEQIRALFKKKREDPIPTGEWPDFHIQTTAERQFDLDREYPSLVAGSWVVLRKASYVELYRIQESKPVARVDFGLTGRVTRLQVDALEHLSWFPLRGTTVLAQSEELPLAEKPLTAPVGGSTVLLDREVKGLTAGHVLLVEGQGTADPGGAPVRERAVVASTAKSGSSTLLVLQQPLAHEYVRATVRIYANVVKATHGETVTEVLGSGDGSRKNQRFTLKKPPLTYVAAATATGGESTLEVRVNGVRWDEVPTLFGQGPRSQVYMVRHEDDGTVALTFGDGVAGARLPPGQENVVAVYRSGIGPEGEVDPGQLALLRVRPLGIRAVTNPQDATGAAAPESRDDARAHAPASVLTLERVVSLQDYEDFASTFAGIGKAQAADLTNGERILVHLTVASQKGGSVDAGTPLHESLVGALTKLHDPVREFAVASNQSFERIPFNLKAKLRVDPRYLAEDVKAKVEAALRTAFSFERRSFGQAVSAAEVIQVMQDVQGVVMVDLDALYPTGRPQALAPLLRALRARWPQAPAAPGTPVQPLPAQLLLLDEAPAGVVLEVIP
ncbi:putative baseplate assembly protein [Corallococcus sp. AB049A]|uniref:putative baseplate assembly protein n=1 Tax=Corallococcus sp. AB049A TaxID=2316721 RepID=UPI0018F62412|nr:putative baseplate assembly protein [Corallococcus sp. AB049A]